MRHLFVLLMLLCSTVVQADQPITAFGYKWDEVIPKDKIGKMEVIRPYRATIVPAPEPLFDQYAVWTDAGGRPTSIKAFRYAQTEDECQVRKDAATRSALMVRPYPTMNTPRESVWIDGGIWMQINCIQMEGGHYVVITITDTKKPDVQNLLQTIRELNKEKFRV